MDGGQKPNSAMHFCKIWQPAGSEIGEDPGKGKEDQPEISQIETGKTPETNEVDEYEKRGDKNGFHGPTEFRPAFSRPEPNDHCEGDDVMNRNYNQ